MRRGSALGVLGGWIWRADDPTPFWLKRYTFGCDEAERDVSAARGCASLLDLGTKLRPYDEMSAPRSGREAAA